MATDTPNPTAIAETWAGIEQSLAEVYGDEFTRPLQVFSQAVFYMCAGTLLDLMADVVREASDVEALIAQLDAMRDEVAEHVTRYADFER